MCVFRVISLIRTFHYAVLVIAANSTTQEGNKWVKSFLISFTEDFITSSIIKSLVNLLMIKTLAGRSRGCIKILARLMLDDMITRALALSQSLTPKSKSKRIKPSLRRVINL